jgi:PelA/Pel-15E family pectate lyase
MVRVDQRLLGDRCKKVRALRRLLLCVLVVGWMAGACGSAHAKRVKDYLKQPEAWYASPEALTIGDNILSYQSESGGWPKNKSTCDRAYEGKLKDLKPTYDNGATTDELRLLARIYNASEQPKYRDAFERGLAYVLSGQYPSGGWPQSHPPGRGYARHITFNDNAMVRLMQLVREVAEQEQYSFVSEEQRRACRAAFHRGIECILKCQIRVDGQPTVWCAQHDEIDFQPRGARAFELASFSGGESVGIVRLLMSVEEPSEEAVAAVEGAVAWFERAKLTGVRLETFKAPELKSGEDRRLISDPAAPPLWARFYSLDLHKPIFVDRDGIPRERIEDIGDERRNGYAWFTETPRKLLEVEYPKWQQRMAKRASR